MPAFFALVMCEVLAINGWRWLENHWWPAIVVGNLFGEPAEICKEELNEVFACQRFRNHR